MSASCVFKGKCFTDHWLECASRQAGDDFSVSVSALFRCCIAQCHTHDVCLFCHRSSRIYRYGSLVSLTAIADDDYAAVTSDSVEVLGEIDIGKHFQDEVHTLPLG